MTGNEKADLAISMVGIVVMTVVLSLCLNSCKTTQLATGYRAVMIVRDMGDAVDKSLKETCELRRKVCLKTHQPKTDGFAKCINNCLKALQYWVKTIRPTINGALQTTLGVLEVAYSQKKKEAKWMDALRPAFCALIKAVNEMKDLLGAKTQEILLKLNLVKGFVCK